MLIKTAINYISVKERSCEWPPGADGCTARHDATYFNIAHTRFGEDGRFQTRQTAPKLLEQDADVADRERIRICAISLFFNLFS